MEVRPPGAPSCLLRKPRRFLEICTVEALPALQISRNSRPILACGTDRPMRTCRFPTACRVPR